MIVFQNLDTNTIFGEGYCCVIKFMNQVRVETATVTLKVKLSSVTFANHVLYRWRTFSHWTW